MAGFTAAVRAELTKIRSLRSIVLCLSASVLVVLGAALANGSAFRSGLDAGRPDLAGFDPVNAGFSGVPAAQLGLMVFGILTMGSEFAGRTLPVSLAAVPRRGRFYLAKLTAGAIVATAVAAPAVLLGYVATQSMLGDYAAPAGTPGLARALAGAIGFLTLFFLMSAAVTALLRHQVLTMAVMVPFFFLGGFRLLTLVPALEGAAQYLPDVAGARMAAVGDDLGEGLSPAAGALVALLWTVALVAAGGIALRRRDA